MHATTHSSTGEMPRCGAKTRNGTPCRKWPVAGRTRCRLHGGRSLFWFAHPRFKHGLYSKYVPRELALWFQAARADPVR